MAPLALILAAMVGAALTGVAVYFWPSIMRWAREHLLPWVDRHMPELAEAVRLAFHDLDKISVELRRAVRIAWQRLRKVLIGETANFTARFDGTWAVQITSYLRNRLQSEKPYVKVVTEQVLGYDDLPQEIRAQALSNGLANSTLDILRARDQLLTQTT